MKAYRQIPQRKFLFDLYCQGIAREDAIVSVEKALEEGLIHKKPDTKRTNLELAKSIVKHYYYIFAKNEVCDKEQPKIEAKENKDSEAKPVQRKNFWDL